MDSNAFERREQILQLHAKVLQAAQKLAELGYTSVVEFGGFLDWTGDIEK